MAYNEHKYTKRNFKKQTHNALVNKGSETLASMFVGLLGDIYTDVKATIFSNTAADLCKHSVRQHTHANGRLFGWCCFGIPSDESKVAPHISERTHRPDHRLVRWGRRRISALQQPTFAPGDLLGASLFALDEYMDFSTHGPDGFDPVKHSVCKLHQINVRTSPYGSTTCKKYTYAYFVGLLQTLGVRRGYSFQYPSNVTRLAIEHIINWVNKYERSIGGRRLGICTSTAAGAADGRYQLIVDLMRGDKTYLDFYHGVRETVHKQKKYEILVAERRNFDPAYNRRRGDHYPDYLRRIEPPVVETLSQKLDHPNLSEPIVGAVLDPYYQAIVEDVAASCRNRLGIFQDRTPWLGTSTSNSAIKQALAEKGLAEHVVNRLVPHVSIALTEETPTERRLTGILKSTAVAQRMQQIHADPRDANFYNGVIATPPGSDPISLSQISSGVGSAAKSVAAATHNLVSQGSQVAKRVVVTGGQRLGDFLSHSNTFGKRFGRNPKHRLQDDYVLVNYESLDRTGWESDEESLDSDSDHQESGSLEVDRETPLLPPKGKTLAAHTAVLGAKL